MGKNYVIRVSPRGGKCSFYFNIFKFHLHYQCMCNVLKWRRFGFHFTCDAPQMHSNIPVGCCRFVATSLSLFNCILSNCRGNMGEENGVDGSLEWNGWHVFVAFSCACALVKQSNLEMKRKVQKKIIVTNPII